MYGITDHVTLFNSYLTNTVDTSYIQPRISSKKYKVINGDTLSKIATKNKTTVAKIIALNKGMSANQGANFSKVYLNKTISIPA
jgi:LysM repeat protein